MVMIVCVGLFAIGGRLVGKSDRRELCWEKVQIGAN